MSTENKRTVKNIFDAIKYAKGLKKDSELAKFVGTTKQNIFNWQSRNNIGDYKVFTAAGFSEHYMRTGEGPMFHEPVAHQVVTGATMPPRPVQAMAQAAEVLENDKFGAGLSACIGALHQAVGDEKEMKEVREEIRALREELAELKEILTGQKKQAAH